MTAKLTMNKAAKVETWINMPLVEGSSIPAPEWAPSVEVPVAEPLPVMVEEAEEREPRPDEEEEGPRALDGSEEEAPPSAPEEDAEEEGNKPPADDWEEPPPVMVAVAVS